MRVENTMIDSWEVSIRHDVDEDKVAGMTDNFEQGRPVVVAKYSNGWIKNITGCHRISAAKECMVDVDAVILVSESGQDDDLLDYASCNDDIDSAHALRDWPEVARLVELG